MHLRHTYIGVLFVVICLFCTQGEKLNYLEQKLQKVVDYLYPDYTQKLKFKLNIIHMNLNKNARI